MCKAHSAAATSGVQRVGPASLHLDNVPEGDDDRDGVHTEQIQNLQEFGRQSAVGVSPFHWLQSLCERTS